LENPSNAPLELRYEKPFIFRSKRHNWISEDPNCETGEKPAVIELRQTRDSIGTGTWTGGVVLARLLESLCLESWSGETSQDSFINEVQHFPVVELGAGTGLVGLAALLSCGFEKVTFTDLDGPVLENLSYNVSCNVETWRQNGKVVSDSFSIQPLDWHAILDLELPSCGYLVGAELLYEQDSVELLLSVISAFFAKAESENQSCRFLLANSTCGRPGFRAFLQRIESLFKVERMEGKRVKSLSFPADSKDVEVVLIMPLQDSE